MGKGMNYYAEFALVETHCPMGSRILPEACIPLCPDRAVSTVATENIYITNCSTRATGNRLQIKVMGKRKMREIQKLMKEKSTKKKARKGWKLT